ncbi:hypothetical protein DEO72_LG10g3621 [Vigna unguiculata]|uniref:Uncharacterized protein n=1 Tax=Vigna unguiculata TaxID=3917 RepID=A0A4D6NIH4_VIGUN|nr:hypothetical protein DEO72_LG10g3621 [Vigna unguiculata]
MCIRDRYKPAQESKSRKRRRRDVYKRQKLISTSPYLPRLSKNRSIEWRGGMFAISNSFSASVQLNPKQKRGICFGSPKTGAKGGSYAAVTQTRSQKPTLWPRGTKFVSPLFSSSSPRPSLQQYPFSSLVSLSSLSRLSLCHHLPPSLPPPSSSVKVFFSDRRCSRCREASMVAVLVRGNGKFSGFGAGSSGGRNTSNESCGGSSSATPFARFGFLSWFVLRGGSCPEHLLSCCDV